ncbi:MAG: DUF1326 domain-containing protein [Planctomycetia bacterium]|nr:DUF1326 domain-containing protein [Planctomycetia bacterium]
MNRWQCLTAAALLFAAVPVQAGEITGQYIEARTCEVFTGPCFSNADTALTGKHGVLAWVIEKGEHEGVALDGLGVVAVVAAQDTLGMQQTAPAKAVLIVDQKANKAQRAALIALAKKQAGKLLNDVVAVETAPITLDVCECKGDSCAKLTAGAAKIETRCINAQHDKACGNDSALFPPLSAGVSKVRAAVAVEHSYSGRSFGENWKDCDHRSAYLGAFVAK